MSGKTDMPDLACLSRLQHRFLRSPFRENSVRIFHAYDLVMLHQIDMIRLEPLQRFIDLAFSLLLGASVDLRHQKYFGAIAVSQGFAHADLAVASIVIPAIVHESDTLVDRTPDDSDAIFVRQ